MKYFLQTCMLSAVVLVAASCSEDDNGKTPIDTTGQISFSIVGTNSATSTNGRVMSDLAISNATAGITKVKFEAELDSTDTETEVEFDGEYEVNLLDTANEVSLGLITAEANTYNKMVIELDNFLDNNSSMIIEGNFINDEGDETPFEYALNADVEMNFETDQGITVEAGEIENVKAFIDFSMLFQGIDFELAETNADGVVIINNEVNTYVYNLISQNVESAITLETSNNDN